MTRAHLTAAIALASLLVFAGCSHSVEEVSIPPEPAQSESADLNLGPGVEPLSFGPGDKSSPRWSASGGRIAFVIDGYVVDKQPESRDLQRRTTKDFGAESVEWISSSKELAILGRSLSTIPSSKSGAGFVYRTDSKEEPLGIASVTEDALAMSPGPDGKGLLVARKTGPSESAIALAGKDGKLSRIYKQRIEGTPTGVSVSPDGREALLAVRGAGKPSPFRLCVFDLQEGVIKQTFRLENMKVFGAPQRTTGGIYYVAGEQDPAGNSSAPYKLYRVPEGSRTPKLAPGVGRSFLASNLRASPDGKMLAIIGRRNPGSPDNLYVLHPRTNRLEAITENENMEIKSSPEDLAWSPDGKRIAIVARGILFGPEVYAVPADALLRDFYNVYEASVMKERE